jgi:hypothetical protein
VKKKRFSEEQIIAFLKEAEAGAKVLARIFHEVRSADS